MDENRLIIDENSLLKAALENSILSVGAVRNMTNQAFLGKVADANINWEIRLAAILKLDADHPTLAKIAKEEPDDRVCVPAIHKLKDKTLLEKIATKNANKKACEAANRRLAGLQMPIV